MCIGADFKGVGVGIRDYAAGADKNIIVYCDGQGSIYGAAGNAYVVTYFQYSAVLQNAEYAWLY